MTPVSTFCIKNVEIINFKKEKYTVLKSCYKVLNFTNFKKHKENIMMKYELKYIKDSIWSFKICKISDVFHRNVPPNRDQ